MPDNTSIHPSCHHLEHLIDLFAFQGRPVNNDSDREVVVLVNHGYIVGSSPSRLQPVWAAYRVAGYARDVDYDRPHLYYDDKRLAPEFQIGPRTFGKKNEIAYQVGHMVPNEVINRQFGRLAQMETFFMTNMSPQRATLNGGVWLDLETKIRNIEDKPGKDHVWAIVGPIFGEDPDTIQRSDDRELPIPEAYYSIVIDPFRYPWDLRGNVDVACFRIPQDAERNTPLDSFLVADIGSIEGDTGLSFFPGWSGAAPAAEMAAAAGVPALGDSASRHRLLNQL